MTSHHDPAGRRIHVTHTLTDPGGRRAEYEVTLYYATPAELDGVAVTAGLSPAARWHNWDGTAASAHSRDPISVYLR